MSEFFGSIYCWLEDFFGIELANYLWGESSPEQLSNMFIGIGLSMLAISLAIAICYYYIINHPRLNNWWGWFIFLLVNAVVNFIVGWQWVLKDYYADFNTISNLAKDAPYYREIIKSFCSWLIKYSNIDTKQRVNKKYKNKIIYNMENEMDYKQAIIDYISSMTDKFAIKVYEELITF